MVRPFFKWMTSAGAQTAPSNRPEKNTKMTVARTMAHSSNGNGVSPRDHGNQDYSREDAVGLVDGNDNDMEGSAVEFGADPAGSAFRLEFCGAAGASGRDSVLSTAERWAGPVKG